MSGALDPKKRAHATAQQIDALCDAYELQWKAGTRPDLLLVVERADAEIRYRLFSELVLVEKELLEAEGQAPGWDDYAARFPQFAAQIEELRIRFGGGDEPDSSDSEADGAVRRVGRYELHELLGVGGAGEVWKGWDPRLQRWVAIKLPHAGLSDEVLDRFVREARAGARLVHPGIVNTYEVERDGKVPYIVSRLIDGGNLRTWSATQGCEPAAAAELCEMIAAAVDFAHEQGIVHRDLTPRNILIDASGCPFVADFGLAKVVSDSSDLTLEGALYGTPAYMAPEQARGEGHSADRRTDVYGMGVLLYELLTGEAPFQGDRQAVMRQVLEEEPTAPRKINPNVPRDLETICLKAMAKQPADRYQTAAEFEADLKRFRTGLPIRARRVHPLEKGWRWIRRRPLVAAIFVAIFVAMGALESARRLRSENYSLLGFQNVRLTTSPEGAQLALVRLSPTTGEPDATQVVRPRGRTPLEVWLQPGDYLVVAALDATRFHEVYRRVPAQSGALPSPRPHLTWRQDSEGTIHLPVIDIPRSVSLENTCLIECPELSDAAEIRSGRPHQFYMDCQELTPEALASALSEAGVDQPRTAQLVSVLRRHPDYDTALVIAESLGKRLPSDRHFGCAMKAASAHADPNNSAAASRLLSDLAGGGAEWTTSAEGVIRGPSDTHFPSDVRILRGGPSGMFSGISGQDSTHGRSLVERTQSSPSIGLRCIRSAAPSFLDFGH